MRKTAFFIAIAAVAFAASAKAPSEYYKTCEGRSGKSLLTALNSVVGPHTTVSYKALFDLYKTSDVYPDGKIWDMYSTKHWNASSTCGNYSKVGDCYNREHSFPKSWFDDASPMVSDAYHIYPTDGKVNGQRSNFPFGECANGTRLPSSNGIDALGRLGTSTFPGYSGKVFEPDDEYKGDFARSYFYMAAAYNDRIASWSSDMLARNNYPVFSKWAIDLLLKWHRQDPVSPKETARNEAVYARQRNRNPFIDYPELAEHIWGDKTDQKWYADGTPAPALSLPVEGSTVDFGTTSVDCPLSRSVAVKGSDMAAPVTVSVSGTDFTVNPSSIPAATVNGGNGAVTVTFRSDRAHTSTAVMTLTSGAITRHVNLRACAVDGIPALDATDITESSFTARWMVVGDEETYRLDVTCDGRSIDGYPVNVSAEDGEYTVGSLLPETTYSYTLTSATKTSNTVSVTTAALIPSIELSFERDLYFTADPDTPSEPLDIYIIAENIDAPVSVSVKAPFEVSADMSDWSRQITLDDDIFYLRVGAAAAGEYHASLVLTAGEYVNDDYMVEADVADSSVPSFIEDFEAITADGGYYTGKSVTGSACVWNLSDVGFWSADASNGRYSARLGKTSTSSLTTASAKKNGIGTVTFEASRWSASDGDMTIAVEYSPDGGATWKNAGDVKVGTDDYRTYRVVVNTPGDNLLRLRQSAGKRGNIDDITVTDYRSSSVEGIESTSGWTASCSNRCLVIDNGGNAPARFSVYDIDGISVTSITVGATPAFINLSAGIYIVACDNDAVRVLIH